LTQINATLGRGVNLFGDRLEEVPMMWGYDYPGHWLGFIPGSLGMILFFLALLVVFVWLVRWSLGGEQGHARGRSALDLLDERFARGEIDRKEYDERRQVLSR
jgi:putative membrane protein